MFTLKSGRVVRAIDAPTADGGVVGVRYDITAMKETERKLAESEQRFREITESFADWYWESGPDHRFTFIGGPITQHIGVDPNVFLGHGRWELEGNAEPPDSSFWLQHLADLDAHKPLRDIRFSRRRADGQLRHFSIDGKPVYNADGGFRGYRGIGRDITDITLMERQIAESEQRFRSLIENALDIITVLDADSVVRFIGPSIRPILGYEPEDLSGRRLLDLVHPEDRDKVEEALAQLLQLPDQAVSVDARLQHRGGSWRSIESIDRNLLDDPAVAGIVVNGRDMTGRKQLEEQLRQTQRLEALGQLTGGIAHDFNNLLAVIMGNLEMLEDREGKAQNREQLLHGSLAAAQRGAALIQRLLAFARRQPLNPRAIAVDEVLRGMQQLLSHSLPENIDVQFRLEAQRPVMADPQQLENAVLNLAINARDAMPEGGSLTIAAGEASLQGGEAGSGERIEPGCYCLISVRDSGCGMDQATLQQAFDPFFTTKAFGQGSGLGLSMVHGFARQSGGHAEIVSESGRGTEVRLYLPLVQGDRTDEPVAPVRPDPPRGEGETVLVVEDDEMVRETAMNMLGHLGYQVLEAADAEAALALLDGGDRVDLLFSDVMLSGGMAGPELAARARAGDANLKVLFCSSYTESALAGQGRLDGEVLLLTKPYTLAQLAGAVRQAMGRG